MGEEKQSYDVQENLCEGFMTAEQFALQVAGIVYNQSKAKIFNLLESQLAESATVFIPEDSPRLKAVKRIAQDVIKDVAKDVKEFIIDFLGEDWKQPILFDPEDALTGEGEKAAQQEFDEVEEALK